MARKRLDILLVEKGLAESREKAQAMVMAGDVMVNESVIVKPSAPVDETASISLVERLPFVGRGGLKLDHALNESHLDVRGLIAVDVGASTGGFTDCMLQRGVKKVYAVDVGYGQLDYRLRKDLRVVVMERVNARYPLNLPELVDLATLDLSFISLKKVIPSVALSVKLSGGMIALVKPQFEAERGEVGKGGIIKDPQLHARILGRFISWAVNSGYSLRGLVPSPILGASGNREFFVLLKKLK